MTCLSLSLSLLSLVYSIAVVGNIDSCEPSFKPKVCFFHSRLATDRKTTLLEKEEKEEERSKETAMEFMKKWQSRNETSITNLLSFMTWFLYISILISFEGTVEIPALV